MNPFLKRLCRFFGLGGPSLPVVATPYNQSLKKAQRQYGLSLILVLIGLAYYTYVYAEKKEAAEAPVTVVVTIEALNQSHTLQASDLKLVQVPQSLSPQGAFQSMAEVAGKTLIQNVHQNEILGSFDVSPSQDPDSITAQFNQGLAFAIGEDWLVANLPPLGAGDRVNVLVANPKSDENLSITVASQLEVIAVNTTGGRKNLIVNVSPEQAQSLLSSRGLRLPMQVLVHNRQSTFNPPSDAENN